MLIESASLYPGAIGTRMCGSGHGAVDADDGHRFALAAGRTAASLGVQSPAQQAVPPQPRAQQIEPQPSAPPPREENPGLINEIGKLFEKSKSMLPPLKSPGETIDDLNTRARDAGESLSNIAKPSTMVSGRAACVVAANGAPDCKAGADKLCQSKGYKEGKSLDTDAAEKCSPKVFLPGHKRGPNDCRTENFVTRAVLPVARGETGTGFREDHDDKIDRHLTKDCPVGYEVWHLLAVPE